MTTLGGRRFSVSVPDWGQDHLSPEVIAAYVDHELGEGPHHRATRHLAACPDCAGQVVAQVQARSALRSAACPSLPSSLLSSLQSIPDHAELPPPPNGLSVTADGQIVSMLRALPPDPPPAGLGGRKPTPSRRGRLGAGMAVTGLAVLVIGAAAVPSDSPVPSPGEAGAFGGAPVVDAQLKLPGPDEP